LLPVATFDVDFNAIACRGDVMHQRAAIVGGTCRSAAKFLPPIFLAPNFGEDEPNDNLAMLSWYHHDHMTKCYRLNPGITVTMYGTMITIIMVSWFHDNVIMETVSCKL
jgi:hypothetical protein